MKNIEFVIVGLLFMEKRLNGTALDIHILT